MIRNVIFDWSGTLVDDLPAVWEATNYVLTQAQRPEMSLEQFRAEFCLPFTIFYDKHVPHIPLPQLEGWFHHQFRQAQDSYRQQYAQNQQMLLQHALSQKTDHKCPLQEHCHVDLSKPR